VSFGALLRFVRSVDYTEPTATQLHSMISLDPEIDRVAAIDRFVALMTPLDR